MRHTYYIPDCPRCGREMTKRGSYDGTAWQEWWGCPACGHESERVGRDGFAALTDELTAGLREGGAR